MKAPQSDSKPFGFELIAVLVLGPILSLCHLMAIGYEPLQFILGLPLLTPVAIAFPNDPGPTKVALLANCALWGFGLSYILIRFVRLGYALLRRRRAIKSAVCVGNLAGAGPVPPEDHRPIGNA